MQLLSDQECKEWCARNDIVGDSESSVLLRSSGGNHCYEMDLPTKWLEIRALINLLNHDEATPQSDALLWLRGWGMWDDPVSKLLVTRIRNAPDKAEWLRWPGHLFSAEDAVTMDSLAAVSMAAQWDFHVVPLHRQLIWSGQHDGKIYINFREDKETETQRKLTQHWDATACDCRR